MRFPSGSLQKTNRQSPQRGITADFGSEQKATLPQELLMEAIHVGDRYGQRDEPDVAIAEIFPDGTRIGLSHPNHSTMIPPAAWLNRTAAYTGRGALTTSHRAGYSASGKSHKDVGEFEDVPVESPHRFEVPHPYRNVMYTVSLYMASSSPLSDARHRQIRPCLHPSRSPLSSCSWLQVEPLRNVIHQTPIADQFLHEGGDGLGVNEPFLVISVMLPVSTSTSISSPSSMLSGALGDSSRGRPTLKAFR